MRLHSNAYSKRESSWSTGALYPRRAVEGPGEAKGDDVGSAEESGGILMRRR
jgi:hypothetical protein